ncbi:hypothetical protein [Burkholderia sp. LMG 21824]|uniref:hypothetical protein n=1 Tax=Burkholderia sp. LMG 21824 TaxID=3158172 RepID=UPI003C2AE93F
MDADALRLPTGWVNWLTEVQKQLSAMSHAGLLTLSLGINFAQREAVLFGGFFESERSRGIAHPCNPYAL